MADIEFQSSQVVGSAARSFQTYAPQVKQRAPVAPNPATTPRFLRVTVRYDVSASQLFIQFRDPSNGKLIDTVPKQAKPRPPKVVEPPQPANDVKPATSDSVPSKTDATRSAPSSTGAAGSSSAPLDSAPPATLVAASAQPARGEVVDQRA